MMQTLLSTPVRILGIGGSIREQSVNTMVLRSMLDMAEHIGAEVQLADVHTLNLPIFNQYLPTEDQPESLRWLISEVQRADGFILASPTYLGSLSGAVKNVLDSLHIAHGEPRSYFEGRPVALASFGYHGQENVLHSLAFVTRVMGATVIPNGVVVHSDDLNPEQTEIVNPLTRDVMRAVVGNLVTVARGFRLASQAEA